MQSESNDGFFQTIIFRYSKKVGGQTFSRGGGWGEVGGWGFNFFKGGSNCFSYIKVSKGAKIRNRYNQVPHLTQDANGKVTNSQFPKGLGARAI